MARGEVCSCAVSAGPLIGVLGDYLCRQLSEVRVGVAAQRARESERADRLFFHPLAPGLLGQEGMAALRCRRNTTRDTRTLPTTLCSAPASSVMSPEGKGRLGIRQIVLPAAGMELECPGLENRMSMFEVQIRFAHNVVDASVVALDDHSAALEAWLASARKVRDLLK